MPVTCQETLTLGLSVLIPNRLSDLTGHDGLRKLADHRQLVTEIAVESAEILGEHHRRIAVSVRDDVAAVDVHHVRRLDDRMVEVLVGRIQGMIDAEKFEIGY